jgi:hypothetical protein
MLRLSRSAASAAFKYTKDGVVINWRNILAGHTYSISIPIIAMYHLFDKTTKRMV